MLKLLLGDPNTRKLKRYQPIVEEINLLEEEVSKLTDDELRHETHNLKSKVSLECFSYSSVVHEDAAAAVESFVECSAALKNGTLTPAFSAILAYLGESVDTHIASAYLLLRASVTEYHKTGLPPTSAIFLSLTLVEPARAKMLTKNFLFPIILNFICM